LRITVTSTPAATSATPTLWRQLERDVLPAHALLEFDVQLAVREYVHLAVARPDVPDSRSYLFDYAEALTRGAIEQVPDGDYRFEDFVDHDGVELERPLRIHVTISVRGSAVDPKVTGPP
jgi:N-methylhydantoinase B